MKDLIKEVALSVAHSMQKALPIEVQYGVNTEFTVEFATAFLAELSKRAEAVHWRCVLSEEQRNSGFVATPTIAGFSKLKEAEQFCAEKKDFKGWDYKLEPLFTFPPIHDIEAIENRVAEACAKACIKEAVQIVIDGPEERAYNNATSDCAEAIKSGEWRKYK